MAVTPGETVLEVGDLIILVLMMGSNYSASTNLMLDKGSQHWKGVPHAMTEVRV